MKEISPKTIYLVDDDPMYLSMLTDYLANTTTLDIKTFPTGESCVKEMFMSPPDVVVLDYNLSAQHEGAMNGVEILKRIKIVDQHVPVIILSGSTDESLPYKSSDYGAYCFVEKDLLAFNNIRELIEDLTRPRPDFFEAA